MTILVIVAKRSPKSPATNAKTLAISPTNAPTKGQEPEPKMIQEGSLCHAAALRAAAPSPEHPKRNPKGTIQLP